MAELSEEKKKSCREVFNFYDLDMKGRLSKEDFQSALKTLGLFIPQKEVDEFVSKTPTLDYQHFEQLAATRMAQASGKADMLKAFEFLDPKGTGKAKASEIKKALTTLGEPLKSNEADEIMKDYIESGQVDYKAFIISLVGK
ncbi:MAG: hypothetical protein MJ252_28805 [archaeon]|nr:hypothetical protein [archaeon]